MKTKIIIVLLFFRPFLVSAHSPDSLNKRTSPWNLSFQYLGITYHPEGGTTPEIYPLKLDKKAFLVMNIGVAANLDYVIGKHLFMRFTSTLYKDCAFVMAGGLHTGPRVQFGPGKNKFNLGIGPIFSFREDWHQFPEFTDDDFYGDRVSGRWQYRFFPYAIELEYLRKMNDHLELQYSLIPGAPLIFTSLIGFRFKL